MGQFSSAYLFKTSPALGDVSIIVTEQKKVYKG